MQIYCYSNVKYLQEFRFHWYHLVTMLVVAPNINVVRREILIGSTTKLGNESGGISKVKNLNQSSALPAMITRVHTP
jgi:hypothetical protein